MAELLDHIIQSLMPDLVPDREGDPDGSVLCFRVGKTKLVGSRFNREVTLGSMEGYVTEAVWNDLRKIFDDEGE